MNKVLFGASVYQHLTAFHKPFMKWFQNSGYEVHAIGSNSLGRKEELLEMGIVCHDIEFSRSPFSKQSIVAVQQLKKLFKNHYFELIHVHTPTASFLTRYVASQSNQGKIVYTAHGFHFFKGASKKNWMIFYPAEKIAAKWTDILVVMNQEDYDAGERLGFKKEENLFYVNGVGVDLNEFTVSHPRSDLKSELHLSEDATIISCIAELSTRKNQMFLLENWQSILHKKPEANLVLVGKGPDEEKIRKYIKENNLKNIHLLGYRSDVPEIISNSDIVTLLSKQEGLPRCLMEAMAVGKPIITTNIRGSSDLVNDKENGFVIELGDNKTLVKQMVTLISDSDLRKIYGENGKDKIKNYSIDNVLEEMVSVYKKLL